MAILQASLAQLWGILNGFPGFHGITDSRVSGTPTAPTAVTSAGGSTLSQLSGILSGFPGFHGINDSPSRATPTVPSTTPPTGGSTNDAQSPIASTSTRSEQQSLGPSSIPGNSGQPTSAVEASASTPTSTITSVPESFSTEMITRSGMSSNSWLTTSKEGQSSSTIVPVIFCSSCGGGVVVWGLPVATAVAWDLPGLPEFEISCKPLLGNCDEPPTPGEKEEPEATQKPENNIEPSSKPDLTTRDATNQCDSQ